MIGRHQEGWSAQLPRERSSLCITPPETTTRVTGDSLSTREERREASGDWARDLRGPEDRRLPRRVCRRQRGATKLDN